MTAIGNLFKRCRLSCAIALLALSFPGRAAGQDALRTIRLREYVGRTWADELVHYPLEFAPGQVPGGALRVLDADGRETPAQLTEVMLHEDGSLGAASLAMVVTLEPQAELEWRLFPGTPSAQGDLEVVRDRDRFEVTTSRTGARFLLGEQTYDPPVQAAEVPAFLQAIRLRSGAWGGRGWFETPHACRSRKVWVIEEGPVFVKVGFEYRFDGYRGTGADIYRGHVRIAAGQELIEIVEEFSLGDPEVYQIWQPASRAEEILWDWWAWNPHEAESNFCFSIYGGLEPTRARWFGHNATIPEKRMGGPNTTLGAEMDYLLDFSRDRFDISINAYLRGCPDQAKSYMAWRDGDPQSDAVGVIGIRAVDWVNPDMHPRPSEMIRQVTDTADVRIHALADPPDLVVRAPLHLGRRAWGLLTLQMPEAGPTEDATDDDGNVTTVAARRAPSQALMLQAKYGNRQLDKIKDWLLEWDTTRPFPSLFTHDHRIEAIRARIMASETLKRQLKGHLPVQRYLREASARDAQAAYEELLDWCRRHIAILFEHGYGSHRGTNNNQYPWWMQEMSARFDLVIGMPEVTDEQKETLKAYFSFCVHMLQDDEFMPPRRHGYGWGSVNMPVNTRGGRAVSAAVLSDNPAADAWIERAVEYIDALVERRFGEDGTPISCPHYTSTTADPLINMALPLYYAGHIPPIQTRHPRIERFVQHLIDRQTPPDLRVRGQRVLPTIGHTLMEFDENLGKYAVLMSLTNRRLAGQALWMWKRAGGGTGGFMDGVYYMREDFPEIEPRLESVVYPGVGAFLRNGFPHPNETYIAIHRGDFSIDHYDIDVGAFHMYAKGVPLSLDFSSMYQPNCWQSLWHNTISWNVQEHKPKTPQLPRDHPDNFYHGKSWYDAPYRPHTLLDIAPDSESDNAWPEYHGTTVAKALTPEADFLRTSSVLREFTLYPFLNKEEGDPSPWAPHTTFDRVRLTRPYEWQRLFLFVKDHDLNGPNYLVVHDDFDGQDELTPQFNLWCLADDQEIGSNRVFWRGQYHVDMDMYVAWPKRAEIGSRTWWHTQRGPARADFKDGRELQIAAHVKNRPGNGGFTVLIYPRGRYEVAPRFDSSRDGHALAVDIGDRTDVLFIAKTAARRRFRNVTCEGAVGFVKNHPEYVTLALPEPGRIAIRTMGLEAEMPAFIRVEGDRLDGRADGAGRLVLTLGRDWAGQAITLDGNEIAVFDQNGTATLDLPENGGALAAKPR